MTKKDLISAIAEGTSLDTSVVSKVVEAAFDVLKTTFVNGEGAEFRGFGSFKVKNCKAHVGRDILRGENIEIPARRVVKFTMGKDLREEMNRE